MIGAAAPPQASRAQLLRRLRQIAGLFLLFVVVLHAAMHWISQDIVKSMLAGLPAAALSQQLTCAVTRINLILIVSGLALIPTFILASVLVARFVRVYFDQLEEKSRQKSRFISMVSHEMRTPLNAIKGYADLLAQASGNGHSPQEKEYVAEVRNGVAHLSEIVKDLLDLSKIEAGKIELQKEELSLVQVLHETLRRINPLAAERGLKFAESGPEDMRIYGDRIRVTQVLLNLLSNAVKFSPRDGCIKILWSPREGQARITVSDQGGGIDQQDQEKLFAEFQQAGTAKEVPEEGTGLGLSISKKLVELHGGKIWVQSVEGIGTSFHFTVPMAGAGVVAAS